MQDTNEFMMGVAARYTELSDRDFRMMKDAGIGWLRFGDFQFDPLAFLEGRKQPKEFYSATQRLRDLREAGFELIGITPGPREMAKLGLEPGSASYYDAYDRVSRFFAQEFGDLIQWWQVANELDIWIFRDTLDMAQSIEFLKVGILAMKDEAPQLKVGINITLFPDMPGVIDGNTEASEGLALARGIYGDDTLPVDYAGFDSYPGSWREGGPEVWAEYLEGFYELTGKPIVIMEFGYASAGGVMNEAEIAAGHYPCDIKKWKFAWRGEHSQEMQAEYIREVMKIYREKPYVLGAIYYNWRDATYCWQCKEEACPAETAWGLLDQHGEPKLSYRALMEAALTTA
ncbi:hypothetical protein [Cerasicoccus fimbriatus]|uniref:hypothetical protein n=1 Tax=Cerasicoccus fimbriatus TaxID=3014554 RepID=UPI0022B5AEA7|nr:hypothetical protein [Cerasicoccus sp. TK19100]